MLTPAKPTKERMLVMGGPGSGKSAGLLSIARLAQRTKSEAHFWVIDTDFAIERMVAEEYDDLTNLTTFEVATWPQYGEALDHIRREAQPARGDWVGGDIYGRAWEEVVDYYVEQVFGTDIGSYFLEARLAWDPTDSKGKKKSTFNPFDGWIDWNIINKMYRPWANAFWFRTGCHVYATAVGDQLVTEGRFADPKEARMLYGSVMVKPRGQKHTGHMAHTILLASHPTQDTWTLTTVKDRGREQLAGAQVNSIKTGGFAMTYLKGVAGWSL